MDIAGPPDIFKNENVSSKTKMSELMRTLEKSEDDLLTKYQVTKASLSDHLDKFNKVRDQGLFLRAPKVTKNREARRYIVKSLNVHMIGPGECTVVSRLDTLADTTFSCVCNVTSDVSRHVARHDTECRRLGKKTTHRHPTCGAKSMGY